jgi:apolipoprotein N-acyltransferase
MVVLDNKLNILTKYNKNKLVPFGEFLPFESIFSKVGFKKITQGYQSFSPASDRDILEINNIKFLPLICYEIIYSGRLNKKNKEFNFIINISEDGWFGNSIGLYQHFTHSIYRSIEEGKNLIRSANNGISAYINPIGQVINKIESTQKGVIQIKSFKKIDKTIFSTQGNKIFFYFLLFYIILIFFLKKKKTK